MRFCCCCFFFFLGGEKYFLISPKSPIDINRPFLSPGEFFIVREVAKDLYAPENILKYSQMDTLFTHLIAHFPHHFIAVPVTFILYNILRWMYIYHTHKYYLSIQNNKVIWNKYGIHICVSFLNIILNGHTAHLVLLRINARLSHYLLNLQILLSISFDSSKSQLFLLQPFSHAPSEGTLCKLLGKLCCLRWAIYLINNFHYNSVFFIFSFVLKNWRNSKLYKEEKKKNSGWFLIFTKIVHHNIIQTTIFPYFLKSDLANIIIWLIIT